MPCKGVNADILVARNCFRLPHSAFNPVSHEGKRRCSLRHRCLGLMSQDKDRPGEGRAIWSHPPVRVIYDVETSFARYHLTKPVFCVTWLKN
jgi:hypothetical protein